MLVLRVAAGRDGTGILLLDSARINRYDIGVPVFGLMALMAFNRAERDRSDAWYTLTGLLTGLAGLTHLYGVFWLPIFAGLSIARREWDRRRPRILAFSSADPPFRGCPGDLHRDRLVRLSRPGAHHGC